MRKTARAAAILLILFQIQPAPALPAAGPASLPMTFDPAAFEIPEEIGSLETLKEVPGSPSWIILIQDAHCIKDAQLNIQKLLSFLQERHGFRLVGVEGGSGTFDPTLLRAFPDTYLKGKVFEEYVTQGRVSGAEFSSIQSSHTVYAGIEDWELYRRNFRAYLNARENSQILTPALEAARERLDTKRRSAYSPRHNEFHENTASFYDSGEGLQAFLKYLAGFIGESKEGEYPPLKNYPAAAALLESVKGKSAESEKEIDRRLKEMARDFELRYDARLGPAARTRYNKARQDYFSAHSGAAVFLHELRTAAETIQVRPRLPPELSALEREHAFYAGLKGSAAFKELSAFVREIEKRLAAGEEARKTMEEYGRLRRLRALARLELTREEWDAYAASPEAHQSLAGSSADALGPAIEFYGSALQRDGALINNLSNLMEQENAAGAVIVAGGFHAEGIEKRLKESGVSYAVVMPKIGSLEGHETYDEIMRGGWNPSGRGAGLPYEEFMLHAAKRLMQGLSEAEFRRTLKIWRDELIRILASERRIAEVKKYSSFIDGLFEDYQERFGPESAADKTAAENALRQALGPYEKIIPDTLWTEFTAAFEKLSAGLEMLARNGETERGEISRFLGAENAFLGPEVAKFIPGHPSVYSPGANPGTPLPDVLAPLGIYEAALRDIAGDTGNPAAGTTAAAIRDQILFLSRSMDTAADLNPASVEEVKTNLLEAIKRSELRSQDPADTAREILELLAAHGVSADEAAVLRALVELDESGKEDTMEAPPADTPAAMRSRLAAYLEGRDPGFQKVAMPVIRKYAGMLREDPMSLYYTMLSDLWLQKEKILAGYRAESAAPETFMYRVVSNYMIDRMRKAGRKKEKQQAAFEGADEDDGQALEQMVVDPAAPPDEQAAERESPSKDPKAELQLALQAIASLPGDQKWLAEQHLLGNRTIEELTAELQKTDPNVTYTAVRLRLKRIREKLAGTLERQLPSDRVRYLKSGRQYRPKNDKDAEPRLSAMETAGEEAAGPGPVPSGSNFESIDLSTLEIDLFEPARENPEFLIQIPAGPALESASEELLNWILSTESPLPVSGEEVKSFPDTSLAPALPAELSRYGGTEQMRVAAGERLQQLRRVLHISSPAEFGRVLGGENPIPSGTVKSWEAGLNRIPEDILSRAENLARESAARDIFALRSSLETNHHEFIVMLGLEDLLSPEELLGLEIDAKTLSPDVVLEIFFRAEAAFLAESGGLFSQLLKDQGITHEVISKALSVSRPTIAKWIKEGIPLREYLRADKFARESAARRLLGARRRTGLNAARFSAEIFVRGRYEMGEYALWELGLVLPPAGTAEEAERIAQRIEGEKLKNIRRAAGAGRPEFGRLLRKVPVSKESLANWEEGRSPVPPDVKDTAERIYRGLISENLVKLRAALGVEYEDLAREMGDEPRLMAVDFEIWEEQSETLPGEVRGRLEKYYQVKAPRVLSGMMRALGRDARDFGLLLGLDAAEAGRLVAKWRDGIYPVPMDILLKGREIMAQLAPSGESGIETPEGELRSEIRGPRISDPEFTGLTLFRERAITSKGFTAVRRGKTYYVKTGGNFPLVEREVRLLLEFEKDPELAPYLPELISVQTADAADRALLGVPEGSPYFITAAAAGESFESTFSDESTFSILHRLHLFAEALQAFHSKGIAHGDLSPAEIFADLERDKLTILDHALAVIESDPELNAESLKAIAVEDETAYDMGNPAARTFKSRKARDLRAFLFIANAMLSQSARRTFFDGFFRDQKGFELLNLLEELDGYRGGGQENSAAIDDFYARYAGPVTSAIHELYYAMKSERDRRAAVPEDQSKISGAAKAAGPIGDTGLHVPDSAVAKDLTPSWISHALLNKRQDRYLAVRINAGKEVLNGTGGLFIILDGHGEDEEEDGKTIHLVDEIKEAAAGAFTYELQAAGGDVERAFKNTVRFLHDYAVGLVEKQPKYRRQGTTFTGFYAPDLKRGAYYGMLGDSPFFTIKGNEDGMQRLGHRDERGRLTGSIGDVDLDLTRTADTGYVELEPGMTAVLLSDGLIGDPADPLAIVKKAVREGLTGIALVDAVRGLVTAFHYLDDMTAIKLTTNSEGYIEQLFPHHLIQRLNEDTILYEGRSELRTPRLEGRDFEALSLFLPSLRDTDTLAQRFAEDFEKTGAFQGILSQLREEAGIERAALEDAVRKAFGEFAQAAALRISEFPSAFGALAWIELPAFLGFIESALSSALRQNAPDFFGTAVISLMKEMIPALKQAVRQVLLPYGAAGFESAEEAETPFDSRIPGLLDSAEFERLMNRAFAEKSRDAAFRSWFTETFRRKLPETLFPEDGSLPSTAGYLVDPVIFQHAEPEEVSALETALAELEREIPVSFMVREKWEGLKVFRSLLSSRERIMYGDVYDFAAIGRRVKSFDPAESFSLLDSAALLKNAQNFGGRVLITDSLAVAGTGLQADPFLKLIEKLSRSPALWELFRSQDGLANIRRAGVSELSALARLLGHLMDTRAIRQAVEASA